jgi:anti-sigma28 factor (negative regulator of flagellin synthesis)
MRIQNDGIAGPSASGPAAAESVAQSGASTRAGSAGSSSGADQVEISSLSGNVAAAAATLASTQADRVSQLAALYAKGEYRVDSMQLSRALISSAISSGSEEEES